MNRFEFKETPISGLRIIKRHQIKDDRGFFERVFCQDNFSTFSAKPIKQINHTSTLGKGSIRGLHYQLPPFAETKIVTCLRGEVWDIAVDLRRDSPTFLQYYSVLLSGKNFTSFLIPEGFAHGFQTLTPDCELLYLHTENFSSDAERGLNALDPLLEIEWPEEITNRSSRDENHAFLASDFPGVSF